MVDSEKNQKTDTPAAGGGAAAARHRVFIDFANTITLGDMFDGVIERFADDDRWRTLEEEWAAGRIGTRACLEGQLLAVRADPPHSSSLPASRRSSPSSSAAVTCL